MAARNLAVDHKRLAFARQLPARDHNRREPAVLLEGVGRDDLRDEFASGKTHNAAGRVAAETKALRPVRWTDNRPSAPRTASAYPSVETSTSGKGCADRDNAGDDDQDAARMAIRPKRPMGITQTDTIGMASRLAMTP